MSVTFLPETLPWFLFYLEEEPNSQQWPSAIYELASIYHLMSSVIPPAIPIYCAPATLSFCYSKDTWGTVFFKVFTWLIPLPGMLFPRFLHDVPPHLT